MGMASSLSYCTWPPAAVWRAVFRQHYSSSAFSKWHQLYIDTSCVLLGLKTALLVDYVTPDAKKLQFYLKDVAKTIHDNDRSLSSQAGSAVECKDSAADHEYQFCRCMRDCCILVIGEDTLLVNMRRLTRDWGIDHDHHDASKSKGHSLKPAQSMGSHGPVYLDVTKDLQGPKILEDKTSPTLDLNRVFIQWLVTVKTSFQQNTDKTELCIVCCHTKIPNSSTQILTSVDDDDTSNFDPIGGGYDIELNVCTLFGQLLGYPVVYWFDTEKGYSLDMVELVCFTVCICKSDSKTSPLDIERVHVAILFIKACT
jgi:hypothetical protein